MPRVRSPEARRVILANWLTILVLAGERVESVGEYQAVVILRRPWYARLVRGPDRQLVTVDEYGDLQQTPQ